MGYGSENLIIMCMDDWYPLSQCNLTFAIYCVVHTSILHCFYFSSSKFIDISKIENKKEVEGKLFILEWYKLFELQNVTLSYTEIFMKLF